MGDRLASVDSLRGAAALAVLAHHVKTVAFDLPQQPLWLRALGVGLEWGNLGVPLFFVVSGFCIHARTLRNETQGRALGFREFWKRRLWRLYPPYFVVLCGSMALVVGAVLLGKSLHISEYPEPHARWIALDFAAHVTMVHGLIPLFDMKGGNPALWTLAREEYFYLLYFPLLVATRGLGARATVGVVFVLGVLLSLLLRPIVVVHPAWTSVLLGSAFVLWIQWCLGMLAAEAYYDRLRLPAWCSSARAILPTAALAYFVPGYVPDLGPSLWGLVFFVLLGHCIRREKEGRWPRAKPAAWLTAVGLMSYSLYLVHGPVCGLVRQSLGSRAHTESPVALVGNALIMAVAGYLTARVFFLLVERHFLATRKTTWRVGFDRGASADRPE